MELLNVLLPYSQISSRIKIILTVYFELCASNITLKNVKKLGKYLNYQDLTVFIN